jgi:8-oxo-dGTP pyrophosphatase MutT (NUDIX family)
MSLGKIMASPPDWMTPHGRPWRSLERRAVYDNPWISLTEHVAEAPTGHKAVYGVVGFKNLAIAVLPLHEDGSVTLVGQHRFPHGDYSWELPEGGAPLGEDPLEGAKRELREEAGLEAAEWRRVLQVQMSNSVTDELGFGFIATGLAETGSAPDETESFAVARVPFAEALDLALHGHMPDMLTVAMLLRAHHMAVVGELPDSLARAMLTRGPSQGEGR